MKKIGKVILIFFVATATLAFFPSITSFLFAIATIMLLPIGFIQDKISFYLKDSWKKIVIAVLIILGIIIVPTTDASDSSSSSDGAPEPQNVVEEEEDSDLVAFHSEELINKVLSAYNENAEDKFTPEMVRQGTHSNQAAMYGENVSIRLAVINDGKGLMIDLDNRNKEYMETLFTNFYKALRPEASGDDISDAWEEITTTEYSYYEPYVVDGIECSYSETVEADGYYSYYVKLTVDKY